MKSKNVWIPKRISCFLLSCIFTNICALCCSSQNLKQSSFHQLWFVRFSKIRPKNSFDDRNRKTFGLKRTRRLVEKSLNVTHGTLILEDSFLPNQVELSNPSHSKEFSYFDRECDFEKPFRVFKCSAFSATFCLCTSQDHESTCVRFP